MLSRRLSIASTLLVAAAILATMVTVLNYMPLLRKVDRLAEPDSRPMSRLEAYKQEYAGGGSCKWRQRMGAPTDYFPTVLLVALLAYPLLLGAGAGFLAARLPAPPGRVRVLASLGLVATGLVGVWLIRLGFVGAALELC